MARFSAWRKGGMRRLAPRYEGIFSTSAALVQLDCFATVWSLSR